MPIEKFDESSYQGAPIRLYSFTRGQQERWEYCNADQDITRGLIGGLGRVWTAIPCFDSGMTAASESVDADEFTVTVPWGNPVVALFQGTPPSNPVFLRVYDTDDGEAAATGDMDLAWIGTISAVRKADEGVAEIVCNTLAKGFDRPGLRLGWQRTCPYALYDSLTCKVDKNEFAVSGTISAMDGTSLTVSAAGTKPDGWFNGGFVEWIAYDAVLDTIERRPIHVHNGEVTVLLSATDGLTVGLAVKLYPGCSRLTQECHDKFDNLANCGAFPWMPGISPFDGRMVF